MMVMVMCCVVLRGGFICGLGSLCEERPRLEVRAQLCGVLDHVLRVSEDVGLGTIKRFGVFKNEHGIVLLGYHQLCPNDIEKYILIPKMVAPLCIPHHLACAA